MPRRVSLLVLAIAVLVAASPGGLAARTDEEERGDGRADPQRYARQFSEVLTDLDAFWRALFQTSGLAYRSPEVVPLEAPTQTRCGPAGPQDFAFYCPPDETIFYSPEGFAAHDRRLGDFAPVVVTAHEWGHHIQWVLQVPQPAGSAFELQADCLAGAYASDAAQRRLLDPGDITEAVMSSAEAGDPLGLPQDAPGAHGINDDRITAFMRGYLDGVPGCGLPLASAPVPLPPPGSIPSVPRLAVASLVPATLPLPQGQPFYLYDEGAATFDGIVATSPDPTEAARLLREWGWQENFYRVFASDNPPPNAAGWVELSVDRFASVDGAAAALPSYAASRRAAFAYRPIDVGLFADQAEAMAGPAYNGDEVTILARRGNLVVRATGIAPNGDPTGDVVEALLKVLHPIADEPRVASPALFAVLPSVGDVPTGLRLAEEHARSAATIASTFPDPGEAAQLFQEWGWRENAARDFVAGDAGTQAGTIRLEVSAVAFADAQATAEALPYFLEARARLLSLSEVPAPMAGDEARAIAGSVQGTGEVTLYVRRDATLWRITAIGSGNLMSDIRALLR